MMRVLYVTRSYTPHDRRFLTALVQSGQEVHYARVESGGRLQESRPVPDSVREIAWPNLERRPRWHEMPRLARALRQVVDEVRPQVVHAGPVQSGAFLAALAGSHPLVTMSWGSDLLVDALRGPGRWSAGFTLRRSDACVCDCETVRKAAAALGMPDERIVVFPWGVDLRQFSPGEDHGLRARLGWEDACVLISTRGWERLYGIDVLLAGFARAASRHPALRLLMLGDGSLRPQVEARLRQAGLEGRIHRAGQVGYDDLPAYYRAADAYVSASRVDGSSVSLMEALACGLPALVSDIPGNREWVEPEANGWWFQDGEARSLEQTLDRALAARGRWAEMARSARASAEARADWEANFPHLLRAYDLALAVAGDKDRRIGNAQHA